MILMYTAQPLSGFHAFEQGAGSLNIEGAVRLAKLVRQDLTTNTAVGAPLMISSTLPVPQSTIAGYSFTWSQGIIANHATARGIALITKYQKPYGLGALLNDGFLDNFLTVNTKGIIGVRWNHGI